MDEFTPPGAVRTAERRYVGAPVINFRLAHAGLAWLDAMARETGFTRTQVVRSCLAVARAHEGELRKMLSR